MRKKIKLLSITGSDSTGGSGIQADIKTATTLGAYVATAITTVTAQNTEGIQQLYDIPATILEQQIRAVMDDLSPDAIKIGMLRSIEQVKIVAQTIQEYSPSVVIIDAVVISSKGKVIMSEAVVNAMQEYLFPLSTLIIIRQDSASYLSGGHAIHCNEDLESVARHILAKGSEAVMIQGGVIASESLTDVLVEQDAQRVRFYTRPGFIDRITHGEGGAFASAVAVYLCEKQNINSAIMNALEYMNQLILQSVDSKIGATGHLLDHSNSISTQRISTRIVELYNQLMAEIATHHKATGEVGFYANRLNVTPRYLSQITKRIAGRTPKQLIDDYIIKEIETYIIGTTMNMQEIAFVFGFSSQIQFNKFFKKMRHTSPTSFRREHA